MGTIHIHLLPCIHLPMKSFEVQKTKQKKIPNQPQKQTTSSLASERSYLLLLQRTPTITLIERKMFLLHLTRQLAAFWSCSPKAAQPGCPAAKKKGTRKGSCFFFRDFKTLLEDKKKMLLVREWEALGGRQEEAWREAALIVEMLSWSSFILQKPHQGDFPS